MSALTPKRKLGQGLSALLESEVEAREAPSNEIAYLNPEQFKTGLYQPRTRFDEASLAELAASIKEKGILHPLVARTNKTTGEVELVAGERRLRAAQMAGLKEIPCRLLDLSQRDALEVSLLENVQRSDLSPIEEAKGYDKLIQDMGYTQEDLAEKIGKSRTHLTNTLRLLRLAPSIQKLVDEGVLSAGHGRALLGAENPEALVSQLLHEGWSVRQTEDAVRSAKNSPAATETADAKGHFEQGALMTEMRLGQAEAQTLAYQLKQLTSLDVVVKLKKRGGLVSFAFKTAEELDQFMMQLNDGQKKSAS